MNLNTYVCRLHSHKRARTCTQTRACVHARTHTHTHAHAHTHIHTMYKCMYIHIHYGYRSFYKNYITLSVNAMISLSTDISLLCRCSTLDKSDVSSKCNSAAFSAISVCTTVIQCMYIMYICTITNKHT